MTGRVATLDDWRAAAGHDPAALAEHDPRWVAAICRSRRWTDASRAYDLPGGDVAVLPLVRSGCGPAASLWSPPAAWGVGGLLGPRPDADVVRAVLDDVEGQGGLRLAVRPDPTQADAWRDAAAGRRGYVAVPRRSHVIDLDASADDHLARLSGSARRKVRSGLKRTTVAVHRGGDGVEVHHALFLRSVERWAAQQHEPLWLARRRAVRRDPLEKLRAMGDALGDRFLTVVASVDGAPAASAIVLLAPTTRYTRGAADLDVAKNSYATYAVQWTAITEAYAAGARRYHMGESGRAEGLAHFKEQFGARPLDHVEVRIERVPVTRTLDGAKGIVKRAIGFRDR